MLVDIELTFRYGLGVVYAKTGKLRHADHHYRRAADINPTNAVLLSSIGSVSLALVFQCPWKLR
jgi:anaphase-promoting complex subunit 3